MKLRHRRSALTVCTCTDTVLLDTSTTCDGGQLHTGRRSIAQAERHDRNLTLARRRRLRRMVSASRKANRS